MDLEPSRIIVGGDGWVGGGYAEGDDFHQGHPIRTWLMRGDQLFEDGPEIAISTSNETARLTLYLKRSRLDENTTEC